MHLIRIAYICSSVATAITALVAARYWYLSSRPTPTITEPPFASIDDVPSQYLLRYLLRPEVHIYSIHEALAEASQLNKHAAAAVYGAAWLCSGFPASSLESPPQVCAVWFCDAALTGKKSWPRHSP